MPYTHFRLIGYQIPTATQSGGTTISGWSAGVEPDAVPDVRVAANLQPDDARIRLKRLALAVSSANARLQQPAFGDNASTLKIFVVPEFYFRPPSTLGSTYMQNTYPSSALKSILTAASEMFANPAFNNWIFVCGTVMWNTLQDPKRTPLYFNTAIIVRGGTAPHPLYVIEKRAPSNIDGVPVVMSPYMDEMVFPVLEGWDVLSRHVLYLGGVNLGVEVCLDHLDSPTCKVLKSVISKWSVNGFGTTVGVQLHVLTAGGMPIQAPSVAAKVGGYILRNDGMVRAAAQVQQQRVTAYNGGAGATDLASTAVLQDVASVCTMLMPTSTGAQLPAPPAPYPSMPQQVIFFPATALP